MPKKYPLEALVRHREQQVDLRSRELADKRRQSDAASCRRSERENAKRQHESEVREVQSDERGRLEQGRSTPADLLRLRAWEIVQEQRAAELQQSVQQAVGAELEAIRREDQSRTSLGQAHSASRAVNIHRERFVAAQDKREQEQADEEALELHTARRSGAQ